MRFVATLVVPMTGLALSFCPVAQADPDRTIEDWSYTKYLSEYGVNYQARITTNEMIEKAHFVCDALNENPTRTAFVSARDGLVKQGILTPDEAMKVSLSAVSVYCPQFHDLTLP